MDGAFSTRSAGPLVALWVPVTRADGGVQMEMQWQVVQAMPTSQTSPAVEPALLGETASMTASTTDARIGWTRCLPADVLTSSG